MIREMIKQVITLAAKCAESISSVWSTLALASVTRGRVEHARSHPAWSKLAPVPKLQYLR